jgi:uncharacterized membrane protein YgcG
MKSIKLLGYSLVIFAVCFLSLNPKLSASSVNDFVISNFSATYELNNSDPQGYMEITEDIVLNYSGQNRGILRAIPNTYRNQDLSPNVISIERDGEPEPYIVYEENANSVLRIGEQNTYITGKHQYKIRYSLENVITFYENYDELYWDVNGDQWLQTFESVRAKLSSDARESANNPPKCFTGSYGQSSQNCVVSQASSSTEYQTTEALTPSQTLTILKAYEKGYFTEPAWKERNWGLIVASPIFLAQILVVYTAYKRWRIYGKDYKDRNSPVAPYFERPKGLSVMQASYVLNNSLTPRHASATLVDLCIRGYLKIIENAETKKTKHSIELVRLPDRYTIDDEKQLIESMFDELKVGSTIVLEEKKYKFAKALAEISKSIDQKSILLGYYELSPKNSFKKLVPHLLSAIGIFVFGVILADLTEGVSVLSSVAMVVSVIILMSLMTKRTVKGNMIVDHMKGLKLYLEKAEKERLKMQDAVAAPLSINAHQPVRSRQFFEKLLPFAVAMNVEKSWAKAFSDIYLEPPDWYQGNWVTFTTVALADSISKSATVSAQSFSSSSSSGSSGFYGGGGFSGGGGGGGGGGGW